MCFHFFYTVQVDRHYLSEISLQLKLVSVLRHGIQKSKEHILHKRGFIVFYSKK